MNFVLPSCIAYCLRKGDQVSECNAALSVCLSVCTTWSAFMVPRHRRVDHLMCHAVVLPASRYRACQACRSNFRRSDCPQGCACKATCSRFFPKVHPQLPGHMPWVRGEQGMPRIVPQRFLTSTCISWRSPSCPAGIQSSTKIT